MKNLLSGYVEAVKDYLDIESRAPSPTASVLIGPIDDDMQPPAKKICSHP